MKQPTSLRQAQADSKTMKKFLHEHKGDQIESDDFDKVFSSMLGSEKPKAIQATSSKDVGGDYT